MERGRILAVVWAVWLHHNERVFKGRTGSTDGVIHEVQGLIAVWFRRI